MKFLFSLILVVALGGVANAGMLSAVVGGAVAGSLAADGAKSAGDEVADTIRNKNEGKCLLVIKATENGEYKQIAINYNDIKQIESWNCYIPGSEYGWFHTLSEGTCSQIDFYTSGSWDVYTFLTPEQILELGKENCK